VEGWRDPPAAHVEYRAVVRDSSGRQLVSLRAGASVDPPPSGRVHDAYATMTTPLP
jgi:hypothetical protein